MYLSPDLPPVPCNQRQWQVAGVQRRWQVARVTRSTGDKKFVVDLGTVEDWEIRMSRGGLPETKRSEKVQKHWLNFIVPSRPSHPKSSVAFSIAELKPATCTDCWHVHVPVSHVFKLLVKRKTSSSHDPHVRLLAVIRCVQSLAVDRCV